MCVCVSLCVSLILCQASDAFKALGEFASIGFRQAVKNKWIQPGRDETGAVRVKRLVIALARTHIHTRTRTHAHAKTHIQSC